MILLKKEELILIEAGQLRRALSPGECLTNIFVLVLILTADISDRASEKTNS